MERRQPESGQGIVPQKQPKQAEEILEPVVHRCGRDKQDVRPDHELCERPIAPRRGVAEPVRLIDDEQPDRRPGDRWGAVTAQHLVRHNRGSDVKVREQRAPLVNQNSGDHKGERLAPGERHRE